MEAHRCGRRLLGDSGKRTGRRYPSNRQRRGTNTVPLQFLECASAVVHCILTYLRHVVGNDTQASKFHLLMGFCERRASLSALMPRAERHEAKWEDLSCRCLAMSSWNACGHIHSIWLHADSCIEPDFELSLDRNIRLSSS